MEEELPEDVELDEDLDAHTEDPLERYWVIDIYDDKADVSVASGEEIKFMRENKTFEDWQIEHVSNATEDEMIDRFKERGFKMMW